MGSEPESKRPRLYEDLAGWWPLLSPPEEYEAESAEYARVLHAHGSPNPKTVLELGSGGGHNAFWLKHRFQMTLTDLSPEMIGMSRRLNPECEHLVGDMRMLRLERTFDRVFVHDAVCYMTTESDLLQAMETAFVHCRPGGAVLFVPDCVLETFRESTDHGGIDGGDRALRYLEWVYDPDPTDTTYSVDYAYVLRDSDDSVRVELDRHVEGVFPVATWKRLLSVAGFQPVDLPFIPLEEDLLHLFVAVRPD